GGGFEGFSRLNITSQKTLIRLADLDIGTVQEHPLLEEFVLEKANGSFMNIVGLLCDAVYDPQSGEYLPSRGIPNQTVNVYWKGIFFTSCYTAYDNPAVIDDLPNGTFNFTLFVEGPPGLYNLTLTYAGKYLDGGPAWEFPPATITIQIAIQYSTKATFIVEGKDNYTLNETVMLQGRIVTEDGRPVGNEWVEMYFDGYSISNTAPGWFVDDVFINGTPEPIELLNESFEHHIDNWTTGGINQIWEYGQPVPSFPYGPSASKDGLRCLGTSIAGNYSPSTNCTIETYSFNLEPFYMATLTFYHWWNLSAGDYCYIDVSRDNATWYQAKVYSGYSMNWIYEEVSIFNAFPSSIQNPGSNVKIRFRFVSNSDSNVGAGWYIDMVKVTAYYSPSPFNSNIHTTGWSTSGEGWVFDQPVQPGGPGQGKTGTQAWCLENNMNYKSGSIYFLSTPQLSLKGLSTANATLWMWHAFAGNDTGMVMVAYYDGVVWRTSEPAIVLMGNSSSNWVKYEINLTPYAGRLVKLYFNFVSASRAVLTAPSGDYWTSFIIPMDTSADNHTFKLYFDSPRVNAYGNLYRVYKPCEATVQIIVKRPLVFHPKINITQTIYRGQTVALEGNFYDMYIPFKGPETFINGKLYTYIVNYTWLSYPIPDNQLGIEGKFIQIFEIPLTHPFVNVSVKITCLNTTGYLNFSVHAHTALKLDTYTGSRYYRGDNITIGGRLVIGQGEYDTGKYGDVGEPVAGKTVLVFWNSTLIGAQVTGDGGEFSIRYQIPKTENQSLGNNKVFAIFEGEFFFEPSNTTTMRFVAAKTYIDFNQLSYPPVNKGETIIIDGIFYDDLGTRLYNHTIVIIWDNGTFPEHANRPIGYPITWYPNGNFSLSYRIGLEDNVGSMMVAAKFNGSSLYDPSTKTVNLSITSRTVLIIQQINNYSITDQRWFEAPPVLRGTGRISVSGDLKEFVPEAGGLGNPVAGEKVKLIIGGYEMRGEYTTKSGIWTWEGQIPATLKPGPVELLAVFDGAINKYEASQNNTTFYVCAKTSIIILEKERIPDTISKGERVFFRARLIDDLNQPISDKPMTVYYLLPGEATQFEIKNLTTDRNGFVELYIGFNDTLDKYVSKSGLRTVRFEFLGSNVSHHIALGIKKIEFYSSKEEITINYYVPETPRSNTLCWIIALIVGLVIVAAVFTFAFFWSRKKFEDEIKDILKRAADQLIAGNEYTATIFKAYISLSKSLKRYGYLRKDSETFREFDKAIRAALPIDSQAMNAFLDVLEEARYSDHAVGPAQRDKAIEALKNVHQSLQKVSLTEADVQEIKKRTEKIAEETEETEILVKTGAGVRKFEGCPEVGGGAGYPPSGQQGYPPTERRPPGM
ncbi:MAG: DUF4129 domain-containing protein, partial [Thermoplasmata archaeon]